METGGSVMSDSSRFVGMSSVNVADDPHQSGTDEMFDFDCLEARKTEIKEIRSFRVFLIIFWGCVVAFLAWAIITQRVPTDFIKLPQL